MRSPPLGRRNDSLSLPEHSSRASRKSKVRFPVPASCYRGVCNVPFPALAPDPAHLSAFRDVRVVVTLFSTALVAVEARAHVTNCHVLLTNLHQPPPVI